MSWPEDMYTRWNEINNNPLWQSRRPRQIIHITSHTAPFNFQLHEEYNLSPQPQIRQVVGPLQYLYKSSSSTSHSHLAGLLWSRRQRKLRKCLGLKGLPIIRENPLAILLLKLMPRLLYKLPCFFILLPLYRSLQLSFPIIWILNISELNGSYSDVYESKDIHFWWSFYCDFLLIC